MHGNGKSWHLKGVVMSDGSQLEINTIRNECVQVCLTEDGFTECCFVSSMHLAPDKETQLRKAIQQRAIEAMFYEGSIFPD